MMKNDQTPANSKSDVGGQGHQISGQLCLVKNPDGIETDRIRTDHQRRENPDEDETRTVMSAGVCSKLFFANFLKYGIHT